MSDVTQSIFDLFFAALVQYRGKQVRFMPNGITFQVPATTDGVCHIGVAADQGGYLVRGFANDHRVVADSVAKTLDDAFAAFERLMA